MKNGTDVPRSNEASKKLSEELEPSSGVFGQVDDLAVLHGDCGIAPGIDLFTFVHLDQLEEQSGVGSGDTLQGLDAFVRGEVDHLKEKTY